MRWISTTRSWNRMGLAVRLPYKKLLTHYALTPSSVCHVGGKASIKEVLDRIGLSDEMREKLFSRVQRRLRKNPERFLDPFHNAKVLPALDLLDELGMSSQDQSKLVTEFPRIFYLSTNLVHSKVLWLSERLHMSPGELKSLILGYPQLFDSSVKNKLRALLDLFESRGFSAPDLKSILLKVPWTVSLPVKGSWVNILDNHAKLGLSRELQVVSLRNAPLLLANEKFEESAQKMLWLKRDVSISKEIVVEKFAARQAGILYDSDLEEMKACYQVLQERRYSDQEICGLTCRDLRMLCTNPNSLRERLAFMHEVLDKKLNDPRYIRTSFERKLLPRMAYLVHKRLSVSNTTLKQLLSTNDEAFSVHTTQSSLQDFRVYWEWFTSMSKREKLRRIKSQCCSPDSEANT